MKKINTKKICAVFFCLMCLWSAYAQTMQSEVHYDVEIVVTGIQEHSGAIVISIHDSAESFNKRLPYQTAELAVTGEQAVYHIQLKAGEYAFCVYHDVNNDRKLNTNAIGIPKEPYGFSNYDGKGFPGNFKKHKVLIGEAMTITIPLTKL